jgi:hypothetical protein
MTSREVRELSPKMQVLWNKFNDQVRRHTGIQKLKWQLLLTCTHRDGRSKHKIERTPSEAFECLLLIDGRPDFRPMKDNWALMDFASNIGLKYDGESFSTTE